MTRYPPLVVEQGKESAMKAQSPRFATVLILVVMLLPLALPAGGNATAVASPVGINSLDPAKHDRGAVVDQYDSCVLSNRGMLFPRTGKISWRRFSGPQSFSTAQCTSGVSFR